MKRVRGARFPIQEAKRGVDGVFGRDVGNQVLKNISDRVWEAVMTIQPLDWTARNVTRGR